MKPQNLVEVLANMKTMEMLKSHPMQGHMDLQELVKCIEDCYSCAQTCVTCADACLSEDNVDMLRRCIQLNLICADQCAVTGKLMSRPGEQQMAILSAQMEACAEACRVCGEECQKHAEKHEHCRVCAAECQRCEQTCQRMLQSLKTTA